MKHTISRALSALLALLMLALPAAAEENPAAVFPNMVTIIMDGITYTMNGQTADVPAAIEMSVGLDASDPDNLRAAALLRLTAARSETTLMGSIEKNEIRARVTGVDTGILIPFDDAADTLISEVLLMGLTYNEISEETRAALDRYLALLKEELTVPAEFISEEDQLETLYPAEAWRSDYEAYPGLLNAVPAGEEEITLFGNTYTAHKYTYSLSRATEEEYDAFFEAHDEYFYRASELDEALDALRELAAADYSALYGENTYELDDYIDIWTDDGTVSEGSSLSEWDEPQPEDYTYTLEGVIWQADEVMGTVEAYTLTCHTPYGDSIETYATSEMLSGTTMRSESSLIFEDADGSHSTADESIACVFLENGDMTLSSFSTSEYNFSDLDFPLLTEMEFNMEISGDRMILDMKTADSWMEEPMYAAMHGEFTLETDEATGEPKRVTGTMTLDGAAGPDTSLGMNLTMEIGTLPEGELLALPGQTINPMEAGEEALNEFSGQLINMLMQFAGSMIPAPQTPPTVGGALLS